jgi:hypothetical protein
MKIDGSTNVQTSKKIFHQQTFMFNYISFSPTDFSDLIGFSSRKKDILYYEVKIGQIDQVNHGACFFFSVCEFQSIFEYKPKSPDLESTLLILHPFSLRLGMQEAQRNAFLFE